MDELGIRRATAEDLHAVKRVYHSAYRENRELGFPAKAESVTVADLRAWLERSRLYVAERDDEVVGAVRFEGVEETVGKVSRLGVHGDHKGEGIGSRLMAHVEAVARSEGYDSVRLTTPGEHPYLPEFYRERGYEATGEYRLEYRDYDEIVMEKALVGNDG